MKFDLIIPHRKVRSEYQQVVKKFASTIEVKGFRKGKAPLDKVEQQLDKEKVYRQVLDNLFPQAFLRHVKDNNLKPIAEPVVTPKSMEVDKDWVFEVEIAEYPEIKLGNYKDEVRGVKAKEVLWTPDKAKETDERDESEREKEKFSKIVEVLLKTCQVNVPQIMIDQEVKRLLGRLVDQVSELGITVQDYLKSRNLSKEQLNKQYTQSAKMNYRIEFIFSAIAKEEGLEPSEREIDKIIQKTKAENPGKNLEITENTRQMLRSNITRSKVVDYLHNL